MSGYEIHFHVQEEIMKRLPVKSLVQFRCVSKAWKSLIDSSAFIAAHSLHSHNQHQHLLVSYEGQNFVCFVDDDTFPQQRIFPTHPPSLKQLIHPRVVGSSHGLLCLYGYLPLFTTWIAILWNPSIRKSIVVSVPDQLYIGFGVCPVTNDPKILAITQSWDVANIETSYHCKVMIYTLSSRKWRMLSTNLPTKPLREWCLVVTHRFIYWRAELMNHNMIISFDVTNEKFEMIDLPDSLSGHDLRDLHISKLRDSLAMLQFTENTYTVWMMEPGVQRLFKKLFIIEAPGRIAGFRTSGVPIMQVRNDNDDEVSKLVVYEPNSKHSNILAVSGLYCRFNVHSYMETLLLLEIHCKTREKMGFWSNIYDQKNMYNACFHRWLRRCSRRSMTDLVFGK